MNKARSRVLIGFQGRKIVEEEGIKQGCVAGRSCAGNNTAVKAQGPPAWRSSRGVEESAESGCSEGG
uniref:Uncharacterized protein n=1 Tax=Vespula pensylvanica TaxID=30213 RepID=A0A834PC01_VESPE|nr:hypothetical protein H0235_003359 [Vespula pensylvanica]